MMRGKPHTCALLTGLALTLAALAGLQAGEGQGTATPGANLEQLSVGQLLYGSDLEKEELLGKVVVVNIGGG